MKRTIHFWDRTRADSSQPASSPREGPEPDPPGGESDASGFEDAPETPGREFVRVLLSLYLGGTLSANQTCVLAWWASMAGIEEAGAFALRPNSQSGHFTRKLRSAGVVLQADSKTFYEVDVPGHSKHDAQRTSHVVHIMPLHEQLLEDLSSSHGWRARLARLQAEGALPPVYRDHPVVANGGDVPVVPVELYLDGVPYSQNDGVLGLWLTNMLTGARYLYGLLRKRNFCRCGCKGWCSLYQMFSVTAWSLRALAQGVWPESRHDGQPWRDSDSDRSGRAGQTMCAKAACIYVKGDWAEYAGTLGFPSWGDAMRPCFFYATGAQMISTSLKAIAMAICVGS